MTKRKAQNVPQANLLEKDLQEKIKKKAYELYLKRGCGCGHDWADWFEAEKIVRAGES